MKQILKSILVALIRAVTFPTGRRGRAYLASLVQAAAAGDADRRTAESDDAYVTVDTGAGAVRFFAVGGSARWRAETLLTKEPETIEWINGFREGDVFWDIGANVGVYSIYAAALKRTRTLAFEPSAANYYVLNKNIEANRVHDRMMAYCLAFAANDSLDQLQMQNTEIGGALSSFGEARDYRGESFTPAFSQGMLGFSLDSFISRYQPPLPTHIKIDVDGLEDRIIAGASAALQNPTLQSLSIELDDDRADYTRDVVAAISRGGLQFVHKKRSEMYAEGPFARTYNYLFRRNGAS